MTDSNDKREARSFEPPPWEREQFEQLERARAERAEEQELAAALDRLTEESAPEAASAPEATDEAEQTTASEREPQAAQAATPTERPVDPGELDVMLLQLRAEEPEALTGFWKFGTIAAALVALVGSMLLIWGVVGFTRVGRAADAAGRTAGMIGAGTMVLFGLGFVGFGVWMAVRSLRQQGVL